MAIPAKVEARLIAGLKKFQPIVENARARDIAESDTVTIIKEMLCDILGYDKFLEITTELQIKSTYCDLAVKIDNEVRLLIEAKAIGLELKTNFVKQAIDYAANQGIDWVVLTNGDHFKIFKVHFTKPIDQELLAEFWVTKLSHKNQEDLDLLHLISRESWAKSLLSDYHEQRQAMSRFCIGSMLLTEPVLKVLRKNLKEMSPGVKIELEEIAAVLSNDVIKREILEDGKSADAKKKIDKMLKKREREKSAKDDDSSDDAPKVSAAEPQKVG
jgi:hypothetical protein